MSKETKLSFERIFNFTVSIEDEILVKKKDNYKYSLFSLEDVYYCKENNSYYDFNRETLQFEKIEVKDGLRVSPKIN